jgi:NitT/TauT family transport system substrate-binding protein
MKIKALSFLMLAAMLGSFGLTACGPAATPAPTTIKVAILPVLDVLPMLVADAEDLYAKHNLVVEFVPVSSAPERDQMIVARQVDAVMNEILSVMFLNQEQIQVQAVRFARTATSDQAVFKINVAKDSGITDVNGLRGVPVGVAQGTVIEYLTYRLLEAEGISKDDIKVLAVPKIPDRMSLLASGELKAATLPEPFSTLAVQSGAPVVFDDSSHPEYSHSIITFRKDVIDKNPEAVKQVLAAVEEAVTLINQNPQKYANLMVEKQLVPAPLAETFKVPTYPTAGVPSQAQFDDALNWALEMGYAKNKVSYTDCVNASLLPK